MHDTEGAIEDMRLAHSYLEDWVDKKGNHVLGLAAKYVEEARAKDPNASLSIAIKKGERRGEVDTYTQDQLAATTLFYEAQLHSYADAPRNELLKAAELLKRALAYNPTSVQFRRHLADVYLNLHDKQSALAVTQEALSTNPKDLDARKLQDHVQTAPVTEAPGIMQTNPGIVFACITIGLAVLSIILLFNQEFSAAFFTFVIAAGVGSVGRFLEGVATSKKAIDDEARKNNPRR